MGLWACLAVISPFPFYYYLWTYPQKWVDLCGSGRDPCKVMAIVSHFMKLIQFISLLSVSTFSWPPPLYFWPLFIFGQFLNFRLWFNEKDSIERDGLASSRVGILMQWRNDRGVDPFSIEFELNVKD
ncbi:hypothetical protein KY284_027755 [Solanum tuberosum]|nr:hypothetical protein KY284_027755 [Solanum tuberosum]